MGLLDNLFKPKPDTGGERVAEGSTGAGSEGSSQTPSDVHDTPGVAAKSQQFLAPKNYIPRSSAQVVPPTRGHPQPEPKAVSPEADAGPQMAKEIVLTLGDVLSRIPLHFLRQGRLDVRRELRFPAEGLAADIARGRASVSLADIVVQCPEIFVTDAEGLADVPIQLPLQKLVEQIGITAPVARPATPSAPTISSEASNPAPDQPTPVMATPGIGLPKVGFSESPAAPVSVSDEQIHLSLAAILKRCPSEIIVRPLPPIDESVRVRFPFAPIERQLPSGVVEISSLRFIAALPRELMKYFDAQTGIRVPLPLEEIFQNLPHEVPMPLVSGNADGGSPNAPSEHAAAQHESESKLLAPAGSDVPEASVEPPAAIGVAGPVGNSAPSVDTPLQPTISWDATAPSMGAAAPTDAQPAASDNPEPGLARAFVPSLRPPVLIRAGEDSGVPEAVFAELQAVDMSRAPVLDSEETISAAPAPVGTAPPPEPAPPPAFQSPSETVTSALLTSPIEASIAEPSSSEPETGSDLPEATSKIAAPQVRPMVVQPPPIFVTAITSEAEPQVEQPMESMSGEHGVDPAEVSSPESTAEPTELPGQEVAGSQTVPNSDTTEFVEEEGATAEPAPSDVPIELDGRIAALLNTEMPVDLPKVSQLLAGLPGIQACIIATRKNVINAGDLPAGLDSESIRELGHRMSRALDEKPQAFPAGEVQHVTLHTDQFSLSLFTRGDACVCAVHRARIFLPGVREKFAAVAEELGRLS